MATGATTNDTHTVNISAAAGTVTATGADTGTDIGATVTPSGAGQAMTVKVSGALIVSVDSSSPDADILIGNTDAVTLAVFKLAETDDVEDLDLYSIAITDTSGNDIVDTYYFYSGSTLIGTAPAGSTPTVYAASGAVTIPQNDDVTITVKGDLKVVDGTAVANAATTSLATVAAANVVATGKSSGATVNSTGNVTAAEHKIYKSRPYFAANSATPSGTLIVGTDVTLAKFDITADAADDITFLNATSSLVVSLSVSVNDTADDADTFSLYKGSTLLATTSVKVGTDTTATFDFASNNLTVSKGETETIEVRGDTSDMGDAGDTIYLYLDDSTGTNVDWGIDGHGSYNEAALIFQGDIKAGVLVTPSGMSD